MNNCLYIYTLAAVIKKLLLLIFIITGILFPARSQLINSTFLNSRSIDPDRLGELYLTSDILMFTKDNEYFNKIADGFTLYGFQFSPYLTYYPSKNVRIDAGLYTQKDFGNEDFTTISPILTVMFKWGPIKQVFGNLDGSYNHRLIEPLYDFEKGLVDRQETGLQTIIENEKTFFDLWVNWETMIYKGENKQEEVSGGISFDYSFKSGPHQISIPLQLVLYHRGGQIDSSPDPIATLQNSAVGLNYSYFFDEGSFLREIRSQNYYVYYKDWSPQKNQLAFEDGDGTYLNLTFATDIDLEFMVSYWLGKEFITIKGGQLYPSVSSTYKYPDYVEPRRELIIFRLMHDLHLSKDISWTTRIEPYYPFESGKWQFSFGFYLNLRTDFFLRKFSVDEAKLD